MTENDRLWHSYKNGKASITGFLEDYAAVIDAYAGLYQITFNDVWLTEAESLCDYTLTNFFDVEEGYFFFTDSEGEALIARKKELFDNVIPASNSMMAQNLYTLGKILDRQDYLDLSDQMLSKMSKVLIQDVQWVTNWGALYCQKAWPTAEIAIVGEDADQIRKDFDRFFVPNKVVVGTKTTSQLPLLESRTSLNGKTAIYVCYDKTCQLPVTSVAEALEQMG